MWSALLLADLSGRKQYPFASYLHVAPIPHWWPKMELKKIIHLCGYVDHLGTIRGLFFGLFWDHLGTNFGHLWDCYGIILDHFGIILGLFWDYFETILGPFWAYFGTIMAPLWRLFWDHFGPFLFWPLGTYFDLWEPILTLNWVCLLLHLLLLKRGPKAPTRAPQPSAGARRMGA